MHFRHRASTAEHRSGNIFQACFLLSKDARHQKWPFCEWTLAVNANLDLFSNVGSSNQISPLAPGGAATPTRPEGLDAASTSGDFAELLTGHMLKMERQGLAAFATDGVAPGAGLQMLPLGSELNVITSDAPMPDLASVAAFARAQGLGDAAVHALFGPIPPSAEPSLNSVIANTTNGLTNPKNAPVGSFLSGGLRNATNTDPASDTNRATNDFFAQINTAAYLQANWISPANTASSVPAAQALTTSAPAPLATSAPKPAAETAGTWTVTANAAILAPQVGKTLLAGLNVSAPDASSGLGTEDAQAPAATLSLVMGNPEVGRRLAHLAATDKPGNGSSRLSQASAADKGAPQTTTVQDLHLELPAAWTVDDKGALIVDGKGALSVGDKGARIVGDKDALIVGDKGALIVGDMPDPLTTPPPLGPAPPSIQGTHFAATAPQLAGSNPQDQAEQRRIQYQQLANRLGETLSQRLLTQIEHGQWKMQMRMQPSGLGRIDVALEMTAGGLSAIFSTDNSVTRELIAQGAGRLKDSLAESGMTVANLWINGDASRQSGGNPTPGQAFQETPRTRGEVADVAVPRAAQLPLATGSSDATGLDVFA